MSDTNTTKPGRIDLLPMMRLFRGECSVDDLLTIIGALIGKLNEEDKNDKRILKWMQFILQLSEHPECNPDDPKWGTTMPLEDLYKGCALCSFENDPLTEDCTGNMCRRKDKSDGLKKGYETKWKRHLADIVKFPKVK